MIYSSGEGFGARFDFPGFCITPTTTSAGDFIDVHWLDASISGEIGTPGLPVERRLFVVPHEAKVSLNIHEGFASTIDLDATSLPWRVMAVQPPIVKLPGAIEQAQFQWEESVYNRAPVPGDRILIEELGIIRGQRLFLMEVRPLTYDPIMKKLTFCPDIEVEVQFTRRDSIQSDLTPMPRLRNIVLNPGMIPMPATYGSGNYLIIVASEYESDIASFATAKEAQGFSVITHAVSPGTSKESIKSYIEGLYGGADSPDYILLVGDTNTIPNWVGGGDGSPATDLPYACMDGGGDWYPDIAIGRFYVR